MPLVVVLLEFLGFSSNLSSRFLSTDGCEPVENRGNVLDAACEPEDGREIFWLMLPRACC